jgi:DNA-binding NarL/FixJ family response regulator
MILDARSMTELSVAAQRYQAVMAVIADGLSVSPVAEKLGLREGPTWCKTAAPV